MKVVNILFYIFYIIPSFILAFFTLFFLPVFSYELYQMLEAQQWPNKLAVITESKVSSMHEYGKGTEVRWFTKIYAQYPNSDTTFKITKSFYAKKRNWDSFLHELSNHGQSQAHLLVTRYSVGDQVRVYTKPDNPKYKVLEPNSDNGYTNITNQIKFAFIILANFIFYWFAVRIWMKKLIIAKAKDTFKIPEEAFKIKPWRIKQITVDPKSLSMSLMGGFGSDDVYEYDIKTNKPCGWGWLTTFSVIPIIGGVILLATNAIKDDYAAYVIFFGFFLIPLGFWLNHLCFKKGVLVINAKIVDTQLKYINGYNRSPRNGWGIRTLVEFRLEGKTYQTTPEYRGYIFFSNYEKAIQFYQNILKRKEIQLNVHPKTPWDNRFSDLKELSNS